MTIAQSLLPEFDQETKTTRSLLERLPEAQAAWKPHPKSMTLGQLGVHVATVVSWVEPTLTRTELDVNPRGGTPMKAPEFQSTALLLELFDANVAVARAALAPCSDADMMVTWTLKNGGKPVLALPRVACMRSFVMNHMIHHRGQLSVYLRMQDVPLPPIYGPTADSPR